VKAAPRFASRNRVSAVPVLIVLVSLFLGSAAAVAALLPLT
jgi:hypothetical protein